MPFDSLCKSIIFKNIQIYEEIKIDKHVDEIFSAVFTGMGGRYTRLRILCAIIVDPLNSQQIANKLNLDYKTVQFNLKILEKNNFVIREGEGYGDMFSPSEIILSNLPTLYAVIRKVEAKLDNSEKIYIE